MNRDVVLETTQETSRGVGELDVIEGILSGWEAGIMSLLTQFGGFWFLTVLLGVGYWQIPAKRADFAALFATAIGGTGLYRGLKHLFEFPRPETVPVAPADVPWLLRPIYELSIAATGYGFPSGHATNATILYGGLALILAIGTRRQRFAGAAVMIAVVCFSRLALGVHHLVDVIGGIGTGFTTLVVLFVLPGRYLPENRVLIPLVAALALVGLYCLTSGGSVSSLALGAVAIGMLAGWQRNLIPR